MTRNSFYEEVAAAKFSLANFSWREVKVRSLSSSYKQNSKAGNSSRCAGGFSYKDSGLVSSTCRNRTIVWQYESGVLSVLELSLDVNLASNALRLVFESPATVLLGADIHELDDVNVIITFSTAGTVYRLLLPHPEAIAKDPGLSAAGEGLVPSILAFSSENSFMGPNAAPVFDSGDKAVVVTSCVSIVSGNGGTTFALPSRTGSIIIVQLPPPGNYVLPVHSQLKEYSVINKLWDSLMPVKSSREAEDAPVSLALHIFGGEAVVLAVCKGLQLKFWSVRQKQCVLTHSLSDYLQTDEEDTDSKENQLEIRKAAFGTSLSVRFAVHMRVGLTSQISVFQLLLMDNQLLLNSLQTYRCPQSSSLVDFHLDTSELWAVWVCRAGREEEVVVQQAEYDSDMPTCWRTVSLEEPPPNDVLIVSQTEPREVYLDCLFHPGRFCTAALCKALELYGVDTSSEGALSRRDLMRLITQQVEAELQHSAASTELQHEEYRELSIKCWAKFYHFCLEYHQLLYKPMGIYQDPATGMGLLIKKGVVSFLKPTILLDYATSIGDTNNASLLPGDVSTFILAVRDTVSHLNREVLDSFLVDLSNHGNSPMNMAMEIAAALLEEGRHSALAHKLSFVPELLPVLDHLIESIDIATSDEEVIEDSDDEIGEDFQAAISQLCTSSVAMVMLGSTLQSVCLSRLCLCRDVLVILCSLTLSGKMEVSPDISKIYIPTFLRLLHCYHTLHWLATRPTLTATSGTFESNLKLLASLEINPQKTSRNMSGHASTLAELFVTTHGHAEICAELTKENGLAINTSLQPHWSVLTPTIINSLLKALWPVTSSCNVCQFLLSNCQYYYVQEFVKQVRRMAVSSSWYSLEFLLGESFLGNGELEKSLDCFIQAAAGVGLTSEPLLQSVCGEGSVEGEERGLVLYYIKAIRLFEQFPSPSYVVRLAEVAVSVTGKDDPGSAILWSTLFKYQLDFGHSREAYDAMMGNPDPTRRKECLRRLVIVLTERRELKELCDFTYFGMEEEIEKVIEVRARSVDVTKHSYYDLLYCYHTSRGNYRKAAYVMYEHGLRLGREAPGPKSLHKQANCYCMTLTALRLTEPKFAWVVRPVDLDEVAVSERTSIRKRPHPVQRGAGKKQVLVLTLSDIQKEYLLVKAKISLIQREPSLTTQLSSPFVSAEEVSSLLVQVGLFDKAITIIKSFSLPMAPVFEALATRCVHLSVNVVLFKQTSADTTTWDWLGLNESACVTTVRENTIADKAWNMLRTNLESYDPVENYVLQKCVARKLLSMGSQLPQWLVDKYKETNPAELLKLYLTFDLLEKAAKLALEYIDSVMGHGKEFFGIETALHARLPSVWLPYSTLDHLQVALSGSQHHISQDLSAQLKAKLDTYFTLTQNTSLTMEHESRHTMSTWTRT